MTDRYKPYPESNGLRLKLRRGVAITGAALLSISPFLVPAPTEAAMRIDNTVPDSELYQDDSDGALALEALSSDALVIEEDGEGIGMPRISLNQAGICRAQIRVVAQEWWVNRSHLGRVNNADGSLKYNPPVAGNPDKPGDKTRPWIDKIFRAVGFIGQNKFVTGITISNGRGVFNNENFLKPPATNVEFLGRPAEGNRMPITVTRLDGISQFVFVPCETRKPFFFRNLISDPGAGV